MFLVVFPSVYIGLRVYWKSYDLPTLFNLQFLSFRFRYRRAFFFLCYRSGSGSGGGFFFLFWLLDWFLSHLFYWFFLRILLWRDLRRKKKKKKINESVFLQIHTALYSKDKIRRWNPMLTSSLLASSKFSTKSGTSSSSSKAALPTALPATELANRLSWVKPSGPSWLRMPGSISVICLFSPCPVIANVFAERLAWALGLLKWITVPSSLIMLTSSIPGIVLTDNFFNELWSFLSSVAAVAWTTFRGEEKKNTF